MKTLLLAVGLIVMAGTGCNAQKTSLPPGFYLVYNTASEKYRWCDEKGFCDPFESFDTKPKAIENAWSFQEAVKKDPRSGKWVRVDTEKPVQK
jgi:hypothetical protein